MPLWRDANRFLVDVERVVRGFPRYHKYTLGSELRQRAMTICRLVARAAQCGDAAERGWWERASSVVPALTGQPGGVGA